MGQINLPAPENPATIRVSKARLSIIIFLTVQAIPRADHIWYTRAAVS